MSQADREALCKNLCSDLYEHGRSAAIEGESHEMGLALLECAIRYADDDFAYRISSAMACAALLMQRLESASIYICMCKEKDSGFVLNEILSIWHAMEMDNQEKAYQILHAMPEASGFHPSLLRVQTN